MSNHLDKILEALEDLRNDFKAHLNKVRRLSEHEEIRVRYLGRKGELARYFKLMNTLSPEDRPKFGEALNRVKKSIQDDLTSLHASLISQGRKSAYVDLTLPGIPPAVGYKHPLIQVMEEIKAIFVSMGFSVETGPEVETDYYNFEALNIPADHPSRDLQDTFYLEDGHLLRTHTSPVQIRTMEKRKPPIRIIAPGRCFRKDTPDATHSPEFHQVEGLAVERGITFAHLKGTLLAFAKKLFGPSVQVRFRPSFFPFTEPSAEYDFSCVICSGKGCRVCKNSGWLEISGAGMVDPRVFEYVGYDPEIYTGYAWGMGVERIAMVKYQIDDIRHFYENDLRFLEQF
ncbi:MAG: phenylalanine--tRNA ligase subunit alpha [bacterium]